MCSEFERLLQEQAPMEAYTEWIESIVDRCVLQQAQRSRMPLRKSIQQFLLTWMSFGNRLMHDLTGQNAAGFGKLLLTLQLLLCFNTFLILLLLLYNLKKYILVFLVNYFF